jgi:hypothetical protein
VAWPDLLLFLINFCNHDSAVGTVTNLDGGAQEILFQFPVGTESFLSFKSSKSALDPPIFLVDGNSGRGVKLITHIICCRHEGSYTSTPTYAFIPVQG